LTVWDELSYSLLKCVALKKSANSWEKIWESGTYCTRGLVINYY